MNSFRNRFIVASRKLAETTNVLAVVAESIKIAMENKSTPLVLVWRAAFVRGDEDGTGERIYNARIA